LGGLLIELVLPALLSVGLLLAMVGYSPRWDLRTPMGLAIFSFLLVALSAFVSLRVDAFTLARRRERGRSQLLNRADSRSRLVKFILGGAVIPIATFAGANLLELPNHQTPMSVAIRLRLAKSEAVRAEQIGSAVLRAPTPAARRQGILALQALNSEEALDQLLHILSDDPSVLKDGSGYQALSKALASYGVAAKPKLLRRLGEVSPADRRTASAPPGDLFERYFAAGFAGLRSEVEARSAMVPPGAGDRLQAAQAELKLALNPLEADSPSGRGALPVFIMQTFLQMGLKEDAELLAFARQTARDPAWSEAVRGQALLLTAKLGGKDDLDELLGYLESPSPSIQARALEAIAALQAKLGGGSSSSG
jgi:hypothetical protein